MSNLSIAENFSEYFSVRFANTKELREEAFKIRYGVYSEELGWEPSNESKMETDEYDFCSYHCLLVHKRTNTYAGCIRLIIPPVSDPELPLPFEKNCMESARKEVLDSTTLARGSFGEISRLAVLEKFRRREKEKNVPFVLKDINVETVYSEAERRNFPNIAMGLYLSGLALAELCNHNSIFVMMEPRLNRRLQRFGLPFVQVGDVIDYHGKRAMFNLPRSSFYTELTEEMRQFYDVIHDELASQMLLIPYTDPSDSKE